MTTRGNAMVELPHDVPNRPGHDTCHPTTSAVTPRSSTATTLQLPLKLGAVTIPNREEPLVRGLGGLHGTVPSVASAAPPTLRYIPI